MQHVQNTTSFNCFLIISTVIYWYLLTSTEFPDSCSKFVGYHNYFTIHRLGYWSLALLGRAGGRACRGSPPPHKPVVPTVAHVMHEPPAATATRRIRRGQSVGDKRRCCTGPSSAACAPSCQRTRRRSYSPARAIGQQWRRVASSGVRFGM